MEDEISRANLARKGSPFLGTKQAGFYLGLSHKTLARLRVTGGGPMFRKLGTTVRYHIDDLKAWSRSETISKLPATKRGDEQ